MEKESFEKLIDGKPIAVRMKGVALFSAYSQAQEACQSEPTDSNLKTLHAAQEKLNEFASIFGNESEIFITDKQAVSYLRSAGWKRSLSQFNKDVNNPAIPISKREGIFLKRDLDAYAIQFCPELDTGKKSNKAITAIQTLKQEKEIEFQTIRNIKEKIELVNDLLNVLVPVNKVKKAAEDNGRAVHDNLLNIPARIAPIIAAELGNHSEEAQNKVEELMTMEIRKALEVLSA